MKKSGVPKVNSVRARHSKKDGWGSVKLVVKGVTRDRKKSQDLRHDILAIGIAGKSRCEDG